MRDNEDDTWDGMPEAGTDQLYLAVKAYRDRFNVQPPTGKFVSVRSALVREILAAVRRGERLTSAELHCRLGLKHPSFSTIN